MAVTEYNQVLVGNIDIVETYKKLMAASIGEGSVYIKAKETLNDYYATSSGLTDSQRAMMLSQTIADMAKSITAESMQMALKIETENRDAKYALTKLKEDTRYVTAQIAKVEKDVELADTSKWVSTVAGWKAQAEIYRDYGIQGWEVTESTKVIPETAYTDYGTKVEMLKKAKVDMYATYSNAYRQNGIVNYTTNIDGSFASVTADQDGLTYWQKEVAKRQKKGFDDNQRQHVVNSSASMISMLLSTEASGIDYSPYLTQWNTAASYLMTDH